MHRFKRISFLILIFVLTLKTVQPQQRLNEKYDIREVDKWPNANTTFGQLSAITLDNDGNVVIFHRGSHVWDMNAFFQNNKYARIEQGPIEVDTVVFLHNVTGDCLRSWGSKRFYMPHGLTVDSEGNVWLTDVALHQVFKYSHTGDTLLLSLGVKFENGNDDNHFCKPTSVAVLDNGDFFIADGYCNSRILKFSRSGTILSKWGYSDNHLDHYSLLIPHALALVNATNEICVADREHGRIVCYDYFSGTYKSEYKFPNIVGNRLFSLAYASIGDGKFYIINGPSFEPPYCKVQGFVVSIPSNSIESFFGDFQNPHDVVVNSQGTVLYVVEYRPSKIHKFEITYQQASKLQAAPVATAFTGHLVLILITLVIVLVVLFSVYFFECRRRDSKRYASMMADISENISLVQQDSRFQY